MGFFGKTRTGTIRNVTGGSLFEWTIPNICTYSNGTTLDSDLETDWKGTRFHFHLSFSASNGDVGFYIHYKQPPIPKYSYHLKNRKGELMRQQTAHTIPEETERCGHWNVCTRQDLIDFVEGGPDTLTIVFSFDDDQLLLLENPMYGIPHIVTLGGPMALPEEDAVPGGTPNAASSSPVIQVLWKVPAPKEKCLWPFTSEGFSIGGTHLVARMDVRRKSTTSCIATYEYDDIEAVIFFLFARRGEVPAYAIELLSAEEVEKLGQVTSERRLNFQDPNHLPYYAGIPPKNHGIAQALLVQRSVLDAQWVKDAEHQALQKAQGHPPNANSHSPFAAQVNTIPKVGRSSENLYVRFCIVMPGNPLDFLNQHLAKDQSVTSKDKKSSDAAHGAKGKGKYMYIEKES